jgi:hypothetical protein
MNRVFTVKPLGNGERYGTMICLTEKGIELPS